MDQNISTTWTILTTRFGADIRNPSDQDMKAALTEIFFESTPSLTEADYVEHPNSWLRFGQDDGPLFVIDIYRDGTALFSQWADADYCEELAPELKMEGISLEKALSLWHNLRDGKLTDLKAESWQS